MVFVSLFRAANAPYDSDEEADYSKMDLVSPKNQLLLTFRTNCLLIVERKGLLQRGTVEVEILDSNSDTTQGCH